jgi:flagellar biosynthesis GTPase FlhF
MMLRRICTLRPITRQVFASFATQPQKPPTPTPTAPAAAKAQAPPQQSAAASAEQESNVDDEGEEWTEDELSAYEEIDRVMEEDEENEPEIPEPKTKQEEEAEEKLAESLAVTEEELDEKDEAELAELAAKYEARLAKFGQSTPTVIADTLELSKQDPDEALQENNEIYLSAVLNELNLRRLKSNTTEEQIRGALSAFGEITRVTFDAKDGYANVSFVSDKDCQNAYKSNHKVVINGRRPIMFPGFDTEKPVPIRNFFNAFKPYY